MPIEYTQLKDKPLPFDRCPKCGRKPFEAFWRGIVQSTWRRLFGLAYCCINCYDCQEIVGYERPEVNHGQ